MKPGDVIYYNTDMPSFSWNNGLKIVLDVNEDEVRLCTIDKDGQPQKYDDGRYMCCVTSVVNPYIFPTKLSYQLEEEYTFL